MHNCKKFPFLSLTSSLEPSTSPYGFFVLFTQKPDGSLRMCKAAAEAIVQAGAVPGVDPDAALEEWDAYTNLDPTTQKDMQTHAEATAKNTEAL